MPWERDRLRHEERPQDDLAETCGTEVVHDVGRPVLPRIQVEDELLRRVRGDVLEEGASDPLRSRWRGRSSSRLPDSGGVPVEVAELHRRGEPRRRCVSATISGVESTPR